MADPIGELEELIRHAFAAGPETMDVETAATFLAEQIAPKVVLRDQLEHVGWVGGPTELGFFSHQGEGRRPVFTVPSRTVKGTANLEVIWGMGS